MFRLVVLFLLFSTQFLGCKIQMENNNLGLSENTNNSNIPMNDSSISNDEFQIYSQLINNDRTLLGISILIENRTTFGSVKPISSLADVVLSLRKKTESLKFIGLIDDFELKNKESSEILDKFNINCCSYKIGKYSEENKESIGVIIKFSRVGFDENKQVALVYIEQYSGVKSAFGKYIILKKVENKWEVQNISLPSWVS